MRKLLCAAVLVVLSASYGVPGAHAQSGGKIAVFGNLIPKQQNADVSDVPGYQNLGEKAYHYGVSYTWGPKEKSSPMIRAEYDYVTIRRLRFINRYVDDDLGGADQEGTAIAYGQRYMMSGSGYGGFGAGWYAGWFFGNERWVERGVTRSYTNPQAGTFSHPIGAAELFYKWNVLTNFYVEPSLMLGWNSQAEGNGGFQILPVLMIGAEF